MAIISMFYIIILCIVSSGHLQKRVDSIAQ